MAGPTHALTVDVEDLANGVLLRACDRVVDPASDVVGQTEQLLGLVEEYGFRATCFVLGDVAKSFPGLVRRIQEGGHEIGVHGWHHHRVFDLSIGAYRESLRRAKSVLEDISGQQVLGYRAVEFSITKETSWAYGVLCELGFRYSSSVFPIRGSRYGVPDASLTPYPVYCGSQELVEIPMTAIGVGPVRVPVLGGGYLRHFPLWYSKLALAYLARSGRSGVMYLHPHELGTTVRPDRFPFTISRDEQQRIRSLTRTYFRNLQKTAGKLRWIFSRYPFSSILDVFFAKEGGAVGLPPCGPCAVIT